MYLREDIPVVFLADKTGSYLPLNGRISRLSTDASIIFFMYFCYRHIRLDTGQPFYIGIGKKQKYKSERKIYDRAFTKNGRNDFWRRIVVKAGHEVEIVFEADDEKTIKQKEKEFIKLYGRSDRGGILCNLTDGGDGTWGNIAWNRGKKGIFSKETLERAKTKRKGYKHSEETRKRMSAINKEPNGPRFQKGYTPWNKNLKGLSWNTGKNMEPESCRKMSESKKIPVLQFSKTDEFIREWPSLSEAAEAFGTGPGNIWRVCKNLGKNGGNLARGFKWKYKSEVNN